jgi:hypothetical protein
MLPNGEAKSHRAFTKSELVCPVLDCDQPKLTTVARTPKKRDGFSHLSGGGHAPESLFHLQAKQRIADWLADHYPASMVNIEEQSDTNRSRIADVMITGPSGLRVARKALSRWLASPTSRLNRLVLPKTSSTVVCPQSRTNAKAISMTLDAETLAHIQPASQTVLGADQSGRRMSGNSPAGGAS